MNRMDVMKTYSPYYLRENQIMQAIIETEGLEYDQMRGSITDILQQFYVETATSWGLDLWEQMLGLSSFSGKPLVQRRSRIIAKLRGIGTITVSLIRNVAESYVYGKVQVTEHPSEYSFTIKFVDARGVPANLDDLRAAVEEIKPAHLAVIYEFTYNTWGETQVLTWDEVKTSTWDDLKCREVL